MVAWVEGTARQVAGKFRVNPNTTEYIGRNFDVPVQQPRDIIRTGSDLYKVAADFDESQNTSPNSSVKEFLRRSDNRGVLLYHERQGLQQGVAHNGYGDNTLSPLKTQSGFVEYINISNVEVSAKLNAFIEEIALRPEVDEIMLDDNFGIVTKFGDKAVDFQTAFSDDPTIRTVADTVTAELSKIKATIDAVNQTRVAQGLSRVELSMSVQPFDMRGNDLDLTFKEGREKIRDGGGVVWDQALLVNGHNVRDWIDKELIDGTINVQIYRGKFEDFKRTYDRFKGDMELAIQADSTLTIPGISISLAQLGGGWARTPDDVEKDVTYIQNNPILGQVPTIVGFDYLKFRNLHSGAVEVSPDETKLQPATNPPSHLGVL